MTKPGLKQMTQSRDLKLGQLIVEFATPGIGQILKAAGCDFALFDTEHSGFGFETIKSVLRYMQAADLPTIVRVPSKDYHHIARAADMGAEGVMLPMVGSPEEARSILECLKYVPLGRRGVALGIAHDRYLPGPTLEKLAAPNQRTTTVRPDRDPPGGRERRCARRPARHRLPVDRPFRPQLRARHPGPVRAQGLHRCGQGRDQGLQEARQGARPAGPDGRRGGPEARAKVSTSSVTPAMSGRCRGRCRPASTRSGRAARPRPIPRASRNAARARRSRDHGGSHEQVSGRAQRRLEIRTAALPFRISISRHSSRTRRSTTPTSRPTG